MDYPLHLLALFLITALSATALNVTFGLGRMLSLAHISLVAVGAYAASILTVDYGFATDTAIPLGIFAALVSAIPLVLVAERVKSLDQFAIATLAFHEVVRAIALNWTDVTRGPLGIPGVPRPEFFGMSLEGSVAFLLWLAGVGAVAGAGFFVAFRGALGRTLRAVGEREIAALALGQHATRARTLAFLIGAAGAGLAGALFASYLNFVDPSSFLLSELIFILTIVVIGRPGSFAGVIGASALLVLLPEPLRFLALPSDILGPARQLLYAIVLFAVIYVRREGIFPAERRI